ncbi:hypothetical protein CU098_003683 [Rhizopus stolonifer]|uniref:Sterol regulatory element-binding protein cleavage-activating protein n=1 Tax=Rhizopus stolonifer TaxID=4846 RepID=A0A367KVU4_RHIST|nr:hypothetical protein CU098_003683 [Rhizopus stolonifer]
MPIRAVQRCSQRLSEHYYRYGQLIASRTNLLLILSLTFISYFSYPVIKKQFSLPSVQLASLDGQCWQISPHVQLDNSTVAPNFNIQQIRLSHVDRPITFELVQQAHKIYSSISTNEALSHICYQQDDQCIIQAPPLFRNEQEWKEQSSHVKVQRHDSHPFSIYGNVTFDQQGNYAKADAIFLSFVLKQEPEYYRTWISIVERVQEEFDMVNIQHEPWKKSNWYHTALDIPSQKLQYKLKIFPYDIPSRVQLLIVAYIIVFYLVSITFGKSSLIKSGYTFGLAAVFLSVACFTTTWGIVGRLGITLNNVSWPLLLLAVNIACLENVFLLTNAVLDAGCDMVVKEKISRGLKSVGLPMTTTLIAELLILSVGTAMNVSMIKEFCLFIKIALVVDYMLEMTFVVAVLSIDIKRVELADLDDRQMSKRLHEIAAFDTDMKELPTDFCPKQDTASKDSKSCADCKDFKTHRVYNALMLCFIVLGLSLFTKKEKQFHTIKKLSQSLTTNITALYIPDYQSSVYQLSNEFWSIVNPDKESVWIEVDPPHLFVYDNIDSIFNVKNYADKIQDYYFSKTVQDKPKKPPSLFRLFVNAVLQRIIIFLLGINIPVLILWLCLIGIITWMTPKWRDQWLLPLLVHTFNKSVLAILDFLRSVRYLYHSYVRDIRNKREYDADGLHRGAIGTQAIFNREQAHVDSICVQTLSHQHLADIQNLDSNAKGSLVSCGQDGRLVLWDTEKAVWMARLDRTYEQDGIKRASWNPAYNKKTRRRNQTIVLSRNHASKPVCVKVDQGNKWIAAGFDDHTIRIWNLVEGKLETEMDLGHHVQVQTEESQIIRNRFKATEMYQPKQGHKRSGDRIIDIQFIGAIPEYCDPSIAEVAARCQAETNKFQNCILSIHKSGLIREWGVPSGECYQTIKTGHTRDITRVHIVAAKAPHRKSGVTWVFTASKDGTVKCWERQVQKTSQWTLVYTVEQHSPITSIATEAPVGGMGILISGSLDGTIKVWNFETGQFICTLSIGKAKHSSSQDKDYSGGPIRHFSNFNDRSSDTESVNSYHSDSGNEKHNHRGPIHQIVATRYCEVENGPGLCRGCDTCFGNGFLVASSSSDNNVHAWRLERSEGSSNEGSCKLCTRDYHRKQYKHHKLDEGSEPITRRRRSPSQPHKVSIRYRRPIKKSKEDHLPGLVDIEQLGGAANIELSPTFLGKIDQLGSYGLVFCDKTLAGVRRRKARKMEWEAWFAPLQYYEPIEEDSAKIPVETFSLDQAESTTSIKEDVPASFLSLFRSTTHAAGPVVDSSFKYKHICAADKDDTLDYDESEAGENLPFSTVRHVIPLDGRGLACDFGNFIKLVYIDNKLSLTEKEIHKQKRIQEEDEQNEQPRQHHECSPATKAAAAAAATSRSTNSPAFGQWH